MEEPQLPEHECGGEQRRGDKARGRRDQGDEGEQPDEVLRRDEPGEREEARDRGGGGEDQPLARRFSSDEEPGDPEDRGRLKHARRGRERIGKRAGEIPRERRRRAADDPRFVTAEAVGGEEHRAAEALDLERALSL